jgi:hypothetical protein
MAGVFDPVTLRGDFWEEVEEVLIFSCFLKPDNTNLRCT